MHRAIAAGGKCLYIVPLRALAAEKYAEFAEGARVGIATGDFDRRDDYLGRNEIVVATSEKVDSLLRNRTPWLAEVTLLVVDEVHLVGSPDRGATLELVIAKLRRLNPSLQLDRALGHDREPGDARGMARRGPRRLGLAARPAPAGSLLPRADPVPRRLPRARREGLEVRRPEPLPRHDRRGRPVPGLRQLAAERRGVREAGRVRDPVEGPRPRRVRAPDHGPRHDRDRPDARGLRGARGRVPPRGPPARIPRTRRGGVPGRGDQVHRLDPDARGRSEPAGASRGRPRLLPLRRRAGHGPDPGPGVPPDGRACRAGPTSTRTARPC